MLALIKSIMTKTALTKDSEFIVGENKLMNYVMALFFFALLLYGFIDAANRHFKDIDYQSYIFALAIIPLIYCLRRARSKRIYLRINKKGIYKDEQVVTNWSNLLNFYLAQEKKKSFYDLRDNFILVVEYKGIDPKKGTRRKIPLTNTQDKSEEEVLVAVEFFWKEHKKALSV